MIIKGHKIEELEGCSNDKLINMCQSKMNMNMDKEMMENKSSRIKGFKNFK